MNIYFLEYTGYEMDDPYYGADFRPIFISLDENKVIELFNKENIEYEPLKGKITKNKVIKWFEGIDSIDHPWISEHTCDYMFNDVFSYLGFGKYIKVKYETVQEFEFFEPDEGMNDLTYILFFNPNGNVNPNNKYIYTTEVTGAFCIYMKDLIE